MPRRILEPNRQNVDAVAMASNPRIKVLIADEEALASRRLAEFIESSGFQVRIVRNGREAKAEILHWQPRFVLADILLSEGNALDLIEFIKNEQTLKHKFVHVLVMSGHNTEANVRQALSLGAKDYIVKPYKHDEVVKRLVFHARSYRQVRDLAGKENNNKVNEASLMLHLTDLVLKQALGGASLEETLFNLTKMVSLKVDGVRCSIVHVVTPYLGVVVTSNDSRDAAGIHLDLGKYPEITHVANTGNFVAIENLEQSLDLKHVIPNLNDIQFNSMVVCPVSRRGDFFGVLSLRMPAEKETVSDNEIRFVEIVAHVASLVLGLQVHQDAQDSWLNTSGHKTIPLPTRKS